MTDDNTTDLSYIAEDLRPLAVDIDVPVLDPANARTGHDLQGIADSLRIYGQRTPIVINLDQAGKVEKGNGTLQAARDILGWAKIAAVKVRDDSLTATGYAIADNRLTDKSYFDDEALSALLQSIPEPTRIPGVATA